ncbi:hypothetical protein K1719_042829 [Acacia pycnantha]|nr:hypothetical protein K1719_042829 [Acacia pycnantha]
MLIVGLINLCQSICNSLAILCLKISSSLCYSFKSPPIPSNLLQPSYQWPRLSEISVSGWSSIASTLLEIAGRSFFYSCSESTGILPSPIEEEDVEPSLLPPNTSHSSQPLPLNLRRRHWRRVPPPSLVEDDRVAAPWSFSDAESKVEGLYGLVLVACKSKYLMVSPKLLENGYKAHFICYTRMEMSCSSYRLILSGINQT